ncbi:MAG TPA: hypothetical protein VN962_11550 [Polyangia bacterium]|nr:hypothetical protein [Polyangia bacterium]
MTRFSLVLCAALLVLGTPVAHAKPKKKSAPASAPAQDTEQPGETKPANEKPAGQANDEEKPKAMLDLGQEAPKQDSLGHVHFASPNGEGLGRVTVNAAAGDKVKVFLEGRLFGTAPITVYSVPKGDYIIEALFGNGKQISKPVTVSENEETTVDLSGPKAAQGDTGPGVFGGSEMTPGRKTMMWSFIVAGGVGVVLGATFGILELKAENDYQHTPANQQAQLDSIQQTGQRDALIADVGWVLAAVGVVGAAVSAWPLIFGGSEKGAAPAGSSSAMVVAPVAGHGMTGGTLMFRF